MSHDAAEQPQPDMSLGDVALLSAFAKLFKDHVVPAIDKKIAAVKTPLLAAYDDPERGTKSIDVKVNGVAVATQTVSVSRDKYDVADDDKFNEFAEECGEAEVIIQARPSFREAMIKRAKFDKETGQIVDKLTGQVIPGMVRIPGGKPTGSVSLTWKDGGKEAVVDAYHSGQLHSLLSGVPMLPAPPGAEPHGAEVDESPEQ
ncbi:hypothetical protein GTY65_24035 [Streptomyces sp. SID8379]|uniref:hypothetical protein n=1 Tax=unclassified Streptomyces TaxID=2593676 RepID=UPI000369B529|nr:MULTISPECIES: hypothetical protein [unclassified Streptomyces]MYW67113.1 hypothetical protein [Streptomyces sp. SID8379]